jgi:hypothetical protein
VIDDNNNDREEESTTIAAEDGGNLGGVDAPCQWHRHSRRRLHGIQPGRRRHSNPRRMAGMTDSSPAAKGAPGDITILIAIVLNVVIIPLQGPCRPCHLPVRMAQLLEGPAREPLDGDQPRWQGGPPGGAAQSMWMEVDPGGGVAVLRSYHCYRHRHCPEPPSPPPPLLLRQQMKKSV